MDVTHAHRDPQAAAADIRAIAKEVIAEIDKVRMDIRAQLKAMLGDIQAEIKKHSS